MCQKGCKIFKQFYAVIVTGPATVTRTLHVFKTLPTKYQVDEAVVKNLVGKVEPVPHLYAEKPRIEVVPIHIPVDILYH